MIDKILNELGPYFRLEQLSLLYFVFSMIIVIVLQIAFAKIRVVKYIPGIILVTIGLFKLLFNGGGHILRTSPDDLRLVVLCVAAGIISLCFARILGIMYFRKRRKKKVQKDVNE